MCFYNGISKRQMQKLGASVIKIQKYSDSKWITEETYTVSTKPEIQGENTSYHCTSFNHSPQSSNSYRAIVTFYAKDSSGQSTTEVTTNQTWNRGCFVLQGFVALIALCWCSYIISVSSVREHFEISPTSALEIDWHSQKMYSFFNLGMPQISTR